MIDAQLENQMPFGSRIIDENNVEFNFWAPDAQEVSLVLYKQTETVQFPMDKEADGFYKLTVDAKIGAKYAFKLPNGLIVPDPVSKFQFNDVHGASVVCNGASYEWGIDNHWEGLEWEEAIIYELNVGTFTQEGTYSAAKEKLDYLKDLGVNAIELMPIAAFPGERNWGYDGVLLYAPDNNYGTPEELKDFIKMAHKKGIMVFLDVVYNHFGPEGNYIYTYAKSKFFDSARHTPWGSGINFSNKYVREFYVRNALYWLEEFHFDGLRFDAVHEIYDFSQENILNEIARRVNERFLNKRKVHLILENVNNQSSLLKKNNEINKYEGQWNDDFHHAVHSAVTGENTGYYVDFSDDFNGKTPAYYMARALSEGFAYQGQNSLYAGNIPRGEQSKGWGSQRFVNFLQNHDQIGNRAFGERLSSLVCKKAIKAMASLYLLAPSIPMLFMGEEWGSKEPFLFFCDFGDELAESVRIGRREEFSRFPEFNDPAVRGLIPDPLSEKTFMMSKLNWEARLKEEHLEIYQLYKDLIKIRKEKITPLIKELNGLNSSYDLISAKSFCVKWKTPDDEILGVIVNFESKLVSYEPQNNSLMLFESSQGAYTKIVNDCLIEPMSVVWFLG